MEVRAYANEIIVMEDFLKQKLESDLVGFKAKLTQVSLRFPKHIQLSTNKCHGI